MNQIDFLPQRYRERRTKRKTQAWRAIVMLLFGAAIGATAIGQYALELAVQAEMAEVGREHAAAVARLQQYEMLQDRLAAADDEANLCAWLHHPWPRSRLVAEIFAVAPDTIVVSELSILNQQLDAQNPPQRRTEKNSSNQQPATENMTAAAIDLAQLRDRFGHGQLVVSVSGETSSTSDLYRFVSQLGQARLFASAELKSIEAGEHASRFDLLLVVAANCLQEEVARSSPIARDVVITIDGFVDHEDHDPCRLVRRVSEFEG